MIQNQRYYCNALVMETANITRVPGAYGLYPRVKNIQRTSERREYSCRVAVVAAVASRTTENLRAI